MSYRVAALDLPVRLLTPLLSLFGSWMIGVWSCLGGTIVGNTGYVVDQWQTEDGLPQNSVTSIAQTTTGYLWPGTFNGLVRFDGAKFTVFDAGTTPQLVSSRIIRLMADPRGRLWIISEFEDLTMLEHGRFVSLTERTGPVAFVVKDWQGEVWLVGKQFMTQYGTETKIALAADDGTAYSWIRSVAAGPGGTFWVNRKFASGVSRMGGAFEFWPGPFGSSQTVDQLLPARDGSLWAAVKGEGLVRFDGRGGRVFAEILPVPDADVRTLYEDSAGNIWVGSMADGLFRYDTNGYWLTISTANGLSHNSIRAVFEDAEGNIWVGTDGGGLNRLKTTGFRMKATGVGVALTVAEDRAGQMYVGFNGEGIRRMDRPTLPLVYLPYFGEKTPVWAVCIDKDDGLWTSDLAGGLVRITGGELKRHAYTDKNPLLYLRGLYEDRHGGIWAGHLQGLLCFSQGKYTRFGRQAGLPTDDARFFTEDAQGRLVVGMNGGGIARYDAGSFQVFGRKDGLVDDRVWSLHSDNQGSVWVGTFGSGLSRFQDDRFFNFKESLPAKVVTSILEDNSGYLWLGTLKGIFRVSRTALNSFADGHATSIPYQQYDRGDGLSSAECSGGLQPAACRTKDGKLWFATLKGVAEMDPAKLPFNTRRPKVVVEEALVDDQLQTAGEHEPLRVSPGSSRLEFRYTALSFTASEKVRFKYQMTGLDKDWIEAGSRRTAPYMNVPPGEYQFRVIACNNDGVWNEAGTALGVAVLPFFWQTAWFRAMAVLGTAGGIMIFFRRKIAHLKSQREAQQEISRRLIQSQEQERKRIAGELHDSLGQNLQLIKNRVMGLSTQRSEPELKHELREIAGITSAAIGEMRAISYALRPVELEQVGLTRSVEWLVQKVADSSKIRFLTEIDPIDGMLAPEMEMNFYRILQESLNNAVKHSQAAEVIVEIKKQGGGLRLSVFDDGRGMEEQEKGAPLGSGLGMASMSERAKILGGNWEVKSTPGKGTRVTLTLGVGPQ